MPDRPRLSLRFGRDAAEPQSTGAIVQGVLHAGSLTLVYGPPKSGKSFLMTDLFASIAAGDDCWMDRKIIHPGPVIRDHSVMNSRNLPNGALPALVLT